MEPGNHTWKTEDKLTRTRRSARQAGSRFEREIADYLAEHVDDRIDRRVKTGAKDKGDIAGLRHMGEKIAVEAKNYGGRLHAGPWVKEAHIAAGNDDAPAGIVVAKRRGTTNPGEQFVLMTVDDLIAIITGQRPNGYP